MDMEQWADLSIKAWWDYMADESVPNRKAMSSLTLLITWEIWNERNARIFNKKFASPGVILDRIAGGPAVGNCGCEEVG